MAFTCVKQWCYMGVMLALAHTLVISYSLAETTPPEFGFDTSTTQEDSTVLVKPLPKGWNDCFIHRTKVAYISALPLYQRFFLSPYRAIEKSRYSRCSKSHVPETREFMEAAYPLPYDPASQLKPGVPSPSTVPKP